MLCRKTNKVIVPQDEKTLLPVTEGWDEIQAAVHTVVLDVLAVEAALVPEVLLELLVNVVCHRLPAATETQRSVQSPSSSVRPSLHFWYVPFSVVYSITKSRRVHDGELKLHAFLFYIHGVFGDFNCLRDPLWGETSNMSKKTTNASKFKAVGSSPSALSSFLSLYKSVRNRLLTRVDFPRPDSPSKKGQNLHQQGLKLWVTSSSKSKVSLGSNVSKSVS